MQDSLVATDKYRTSHIRNETRSHSSATQHVLFIHPHHNLIGKGNTHAKVPSMSLSAWHSAAAKIMSSFTLSICTQHRRIHNHNPISMSDRNLHQRTRMYTSNHMDECDGLCTYVCEYVCD